MHSLVVMDDGDVQNLSVNIQPHQVDIDELNASLKGRQLSDKSADTQLDDVNQRWSLMLQHIIDSKVGVFFILLMSASVPSVL